MPMDMNDEPSMQLQSGGVSAVLDRVSDLYRRNVKTFVLIGLLVWVPITLLQTFATQTFGRTMDTPDGDKLVAMVLMALVALIPILAAFFIQSAAVDVAAAEASLGQRPSVSSAYVGALRKVGPIFVVTLLYSLIVGVGFMFFMVPGIIFMFRYAYALPIVVVEGLSPTEALARSGELTEGRKGKLFLSFVVVGIASSLVQGIWLRCFGGVMTPFVGDLLRCVPAVLTAPLVPLVVMVDYLAARGAAEQV